MNPNQNNNRGNGGNKRNVTAIVSVLLWALVLTLLVNVATSRFQQANSVEVLYGQFRDLVMDGVVDSVLMESDRYTFTLKEGYTLQFDDDGNVEAVKEDSQASSADTSGGESGGHRRRDHRRPAGSPRAGGAHPHPRAAPPGRAAAARPRPPPWSTSAPP